MNLQEIDNALAEWNNRLAVIAKNLLELQADSTYQVLTGSGGAAKLELTGVTAAQVEPPLGAMLTIFQHFGLLHDAINKASALRANLPTLFGSEAKVIEIRRLLRERSIRLPELDAPFEQRTLLSGVQRADCFSPDELLGLMSKTFVAARDAVLMVDAAWKQLAPEMDRAAAQVSRFSAGSEALRGRGAADRNSADALLQELRTKVACDPFGVSAELQARLRPALARLAELSAAEEALAESMRAAGAQLEAFRQVRSGAQDAFEKACIKIVAADRLPLPAPGEKQEEFRVWLERLERRRGEGLLDAVTVGLRNWRAAMDACIAQERATCAAHRGLLETRAELRGRLDALRAKARAYGIAEETPVAGASQQAEALLYARPTDLELAGAAVRDFEQRVSGGRRTGRTAEVKPL